jgi:hypothetical protein
MLRFFNNNQIHTAFFVILAALPFLISPLYIAEPASYNLPDFIDFFKLNSHLSLAIFSVLILVQAFWLNYLVNYYRIGKKTSYYSAIIFVLVTVSFNSKGVLSSSLFSSLLIIAAIQQYFKAYDNKNTVKEIFNAAFFCATAVILNPQTIVFLIFAIASWLKVRSFNTKEFFIILLGLLLPFYLIGTYMYLNDTLLKYINYQFGYFALINTTINANLIFWMLISGIGLLSLISIINFQRIKAKTNIREQKYIDLMFYLLFFSCFFWIGNSKIDANSLSLLGLPLSVLISLNLQSIKNQRLAELQFFVLLAVAILANYGEQIFKIFGL